MYSYTYQLVRFALSTQERNLKMMVHFKLMIAQSAMSEL